MAFYNNKKILFDLNQSHAMMKQYKQQYSQNELIEHNMELLFSKNKEKKEKMKMKKKITKITTVGFFFFFF